MLMVPVTVDELARLASDGRLDGQLCGVAADDALADEFGVEPGEEAEAAALQLADVLGLTMGKALADSGVAHRRVLVVDVPADHLTTGEGSVVGIQTPIQAADAVSFFVGQCDATTAEAARGLDVDEAWELPAVRAMLAEQPLQWHDVSELALLDELVQP